MDINQIILDSENIKTVNWDELNIKDDILRSIYRYGFEKPTPIQVASIKPIIECRDLIAQAQSGTGKTGAFTISSLHKVNTDDDKTQIIMLAPTRELVMQIYDVVCELGGTIENIRIKTFVGGTSVNDDIDYLKKTQPHIAIATIGRLYDMVYRRKLNTKYVKIIVMDEADELLSKGFKSQIYDLFQFLPKQLQVILFSATMPNDVIKLGERIANDPLKIIVEPEKLSLECIQQYYVALRNDFMKYETLKDLFNVMQLNQTIIYVNTINKVDYLYEMLHKDGFPVGCIHSDMSKTERETSLKKFRNGQFRILVSSGITSRGIDVQQVSTVILYDVPYNVHTYLHAIGRSGRYGRKGLAINFVTNRDVSLMRNIEHQFL